MSKADVDFIKLVASDYGYNINLAQVKIAWQHTKGDYYELKEYFGG